jgi:hypothetical protein
MTVFHAGDGGAPVWRSSSNMRCRGGNKVERRPVNHLFALALLLWSVTGCGIMSGNIEGTAFLIDRKGSVAPVTKGKAVLLKSSLTSDLRKKFCWWDDNLACQTGAEKEKLGDLCDDMLVISFFSDSLLPESLNLDNWCSCKAEQADREAEGRKQSCREIRKGFDECSAKAAGLKEIYLKKLRLSKEYDRKAKESVNAGKVKEEQAEQAVAVSKSHYSFYKGSMYDSRYWLDKAGSELFSYDDSSIYLTRYCLEQSRNDSNSAQSHLNLAKAWLAYAEKMYREAEECAKRAEAQQRKSDETKCEAENYRDLAKAHQQLAEEFGKKTDETEKEAQSSKERSALYESLPVRFDRGLSTDEISSILSIRSSSVFFLKRLNTSCGVAQVKDIPRWYSETRASISDLLEKNIAAETSLSDTGDFRFTHIPNGQYYLIILPDTGNENQFIIRRISCKGGSGKIILSGDCVYSIKHNGVLRNGLAPFLLTGGKSAILPSPADHQYGITPEAAFL